MKMEEINKIIRDLWRSTYRGQGSRHGARRVLFPKPIPALTLPGFSASQYCLLDLPEQL